MPCRLDWPSARDWPPRSWPRVSKSRNVPRAARGMGGTIAEALRIVRGNRQLLALSSSPPRSGLSPRSSISTPRRCLLNVGWRHRRSVSFLARPSSRPRSEHGWPGGWRACAPSGSGRLPRPEPSPGRVCSWVAPRYPLHVLGLIVAELFAGAFEPMIAQRVNTAITSAQRATVLSVEGFSTR